MSSLEFKLCTFRLKGFQAVGLGIGKDPATVIDAQRLFAYLNQAQREEDFLVWPGNLEMLHVLDNWSYFEPLFAKAAEMIDSNELPAGELEDFTHDVSEIKSRTTSAQPEESIERRW